MINKRYVSLVAERFVPLVSIPENQDYEAYVYLVVFQHNKTKKYYLGYHVGLFDGTYKGSPKTHETEFRRDLGKYSYKIYCLDIGMAANMIYKEKLMLDQIKQDGNWSEMYNESTGGGRQLKNYNPFVEQIQNAVEDGELETEFLPKEDVVKMKWWQVRFHTLFLSHVKELVDLIEESDGAWLVEHHRGVLCLQDYYGIGKHCRLGSAHTTAAAMKVDQVIELKVIWIPKKLWKKLDKSDIKEIGQWDNPQEKTPRVKTDKDETSLWIAQACLEKGIKPTHFSFTRKLQRQGYTARQIPSRITRAEKYLEDIEVLNNSGEKQVHWELEPWKSELETKIRSFKGIAFSAAVGMNEKMVSRLLSYFMHNPTETKFKIFAYVTHGLGARRHHEEWGMNGRPWVKTYFNMFMKDFRTDKNGKPTLQIDVEDLQFSTPDSDSIN